jgi:hypothetical protein
MSTAPVVKVAGTGAAAATHTTASYTPQANSRELAFVSSYKATASPALPTITDSAGNNWTLLAEFQTTTFVNPAIRSAWYISDDVGGSPAARTVTVAATGAGQMAVIIADVLSVDTNGTLAQTAVAGEDLANGDPACTFGSTPGATNIALLGASFGGGNTATKPASFASIASALSSTARWNAASYDITNASIGPNQYTSNNIRAIIVGIELSPAGAGSQSVTGVLFSDGDTFFASTVARGAVGVTGTLFSNAGSFFGATVSASYGVAGNLFSNSNALFGASVSASSGITGSLLTDSDAFFASVTTTAYGISGALYSDADTFYGATATTTVGVSGALFTDADTFFAASLARSAVTISGALFADADTFRNAAVSNGSASQAIAAALFVDDDIFFTAALTSLRAIGGSPVSDADSFFVGAVSSTYGIATIRVNNSATFYGASVSTAAVIAAYLFAEDDTFFGATLASGQTVNGILVVDPDTFFISAVSFVRRIRTGSRTGISTSSRRPSARQATRTPTAQLVAAWPTILAAIRPTPTQVQ